MRSMLTKSDYERFAAEKQCVEQAVTMWKEWMSKQNGDRDERAAQGTVHVGVQTAKRKKPTLRISEPFSP